MSTTLRAVPDTDDAPKPTPDPGTLHHFARIVGMVAKAADRYDWSGLDLGNFRGESHALGNDFRLIQRDLREIGEELAEDFAAANDFADDVADEKRRERRGAEAAELRQLLGA